MAAMRHKLAKDDITSSAEEKKIQNESVLDFKILFKFLWIWG